MNDTKTNIDLVSIIDDDEQLLQALGNLLKEAGFSTQTFASAEDFLASPPFDGSTCLILDVRLPGISGIELQSRLRTANHRIPIIFITAHGDASVRDLVLKAGATDFLNKPVRRQILLDAVLKALGKAPN